jgi:hypothetical protein
VPFPLQNACHDGWDGPRQEVALETEEVPSMIPILSSTLTTNSQPGLAKIMVS